MFSNDSLAPVVDNVELLIAELKQLRCSGPHFRIVHRFRMPGTDCMPGEEVAAILLVHRGHEYYLRLSLALRILLDYLARNSRLPQSARQIELGIRADEFSQEHAVNANGRRAITRRITRSAVKEYVKRLRRALSLAFREAGLRVDPCKVLVSQETVANEVGYLLRAHFEWVHVDLAGRDYQPISDGNG